MIIEEKEYCDWRFVLSVDEMKQWRKMIIVTFVTWKKHIYWKIYFPGNIQNSASLSCNGCRGRAHNQAPLWSSYTCTSNFNHDAKYASQLKIIITSILGKLQPQQVGLLQNLWSVILHWTRNSTWASDILILCTCHKKSQYNKVRLLVNQIISLFTFWSISTYYMVHEHLNLFVYTSNWFNSIWADLQNYRDFTVATLP